RSPAYCPWRMTAGAAGLGVTPGDDEGRVSLPVPSPSWMRWRMRTRIRQLREQLGLSQFRLAAYAGVSRSTLRKYENGDVRARTETLARIAEALGVSVDELL